MTVAGFSVKLKEISTKPELLAGGHRLCAGCVAPVIVRHILLAADYPVLAANSTGCLEVGTSIYPFTSWRVPWFHSAFENAAATITGMEAMYQSLKKQGKIPADKVLKFVAFSGDGGTYDIGLQSLSGAIERGHDFLYVCYDNGAYMNTGIQRSSSTPLGAATTTSPKGSVIPGKQQWRKDLTAIIAAHDRPELPECHLHLPPGVEKPARKIYRHPAGGGEHLFLASLRGGETEGNHQLPAPGKKAGHRVVEASGAFPAPLCP
jgi:pyruvate ferredoxin oxidoreductase beta subunit